MKRQIYYNKKFYSKIRELTPYVIDLGFRHKIHTGGYIDNISISNLDYRKNFPTLATIKIEPNYKNKFLSIIFINDGGNKKNQLEISFYFKKDIKKFIKLCIQEELLEDNFNNNILLKGIFK